MAVEVRDRFHAKQGRTIARYTLTRDGRTLVVYLKRHYRHSARRGWLAAVFPSRAWSDGLCEWTHLEQAEGLGIPVPPAMAAAQWVGPRGRLQSLLASAELTDQLALHEAIPLASRTLPPEAFDLWKRGLIAEMVRLSKRMHDRKWFHQDLYLCHFYVAVADIENPPPSWAGRATMIDFHRFGRHRVQSLRYRVKDLAQLLFSSEVEGVTPRDRVRFARAYFGPRRARWEKKLILLKYRRYRRHNAG